MKNGPAFRGGKRQSIFVLRSGKAVRTEVTVGQRNGDFIEIISGLQEGDRIIISDTEEFEQLSEIQLSE